MAIQKSNRVTRRSRRSSGTSIIPNTTASMITAPRTAFGRSENSGASSSSVRISSPRVISEAIGVLAPADSFSELAEMLVENGMVLRFWGSARDVTAMREAEDALAQHDSQLRALATEITLAEERARRKLASELHDGPAQNLAGMAMQLAELKRKTQDHHHLTLIDEAEQVLADTTLQTRTLMLELAPPGLHDTGLIEALRWLADRVGKQQRLSVTVEDDGVPKSLEDQVTVLLFQTVRELLQNVVKHARSKRATVRCAVNNDVLSLDVIDPGVGFEVHSIDRLPTRQGGFGLFNIRERLKLMGGSIDIHSIVGEGTTVRIRVPLKSQHGLFDEALRA